MKKIITIFTLALLAAVNFAADAAKLSLTIEVNDPELALVQQYVFASEATTTDLTFDDQNQCHIEYPDDANESFLILYITPINPEAEEGEEEAEDVETIYFRSYKIYNAEGDLITEQDVFAKNRKYVYLKPEYDGGTMVIDMGPLEDLHFTLNVEGDPARFSLMLKDRKINDIVTGSQQVAFTPDENYIYIKARGKDGLYSVKHNDTEIPMKSEGVEGESITYYYLISNQADGDVVEIITDESTSISSISPDSAATRIYNLQGVEVPANSPLSPGIYIINGKKVNYYN